MTDADLIYNAMLRAEARMERHVLALDKMQQPAARVATEVAFLAVRTIREEIGNGLSSESR